jgi:hypothetical protein
MARSAAMTPRKLRAFIRKQIPSPSRAMAMPAREGPTSRARLKREEFRAMALPRSDRSSTMRTTKACRAGMSKAFTTPRKTPQTRMAP